jgi:hypothetical protein
VALRFRPVDASFYDLFTKSANQLVQGAALLAEMLSDGSDRRGIAEKMREQEHLADEATHEVIRKVNKTFVTPFDREDIIDLASSLDDICDFTEEVADFLGLYRIEAPMEQAVQLAKVLVDACRQIEEALPRLRNYSDISHFVTEIHRLENDGDRLERSALASLFEQGIDPMVVIRWKDIFERLEEAVDATEKVANILSGIVIKNA